MFTYAVEDWERLREDPALRGLWGTHYGEVGKNKERFRLEPDEAKAGRLAALGQMHWVCVRRDGELVGYHLSLVDTLFHYRSILAAVGDMYYLRPDCRVGRVALRLFQEVERSLRQRGVQMLFDFTKLGALDHGPLLEHLGYAPLERKYMKWIGD